ncbi:protoporphyrinogen oxidase [Balneola sp. MJW-20]|uniref:protoporphyrinogen oxidase n=1 Tax=Gracilimonas aurantiaca TaxID=3234185 RepID=UPI0034662A66
MKQVAVIGGGISGLTTAYYLGQNGISVDLYEKERLGGSIESVRLGDTVLDLGPNSLRDKTGSLNKLIIELGLEDEVLDVSEAFKTRCIVRNGELQFLQPSPSSLIRTSLLSVSGKIRLLTEPFRSAPGKRDESVRSFLERRIGKEAVNYLADPVFSGIYAGDISKLSKLEVLSELSRYEEEMGSLFKGLIQARKKDRSSPRVLNFRNGIQSLTNTLADRSEADLFNEEVSAIILTGKGYKIEAGPVQEEYEKVISCIPAYVLAGLIEDRKLSEQLRSIDYPSVHSVQLIYRKEDLKDLPEGFGFLVPRKEGLTILGSIWKSSIFPEMTDEKYVQFNLLSGGAHQKLKAEQVADTERKVITEFENIMDIRALPIERYSKFWDKAIPQFHVGYSKIRNEISRFEKQNPGFYIGGNFRWGVAVPECIEAAEKLSKQIIT